MTAIGSPVATRIYLDDIFPVEFRICVTSMNNVTGKVTRIERSSKNPWVFLYAAQLDAPASVYNNQGKLVQTNYVYLYSREFERIH